MRKKKYFKTNQYITAKTVRVVTDAGSQLGVMSIEKARQKAKDAGLDLVEVAAVTKPPVVRITDFQAFLTRYLKQSTGGRYRSKQSIKQIRFKPFVDNQDFEVKIEKITKFLSQGSKVKITIFFYGRTITHKHLGDQLMVKIIDRFQNEATLENNPVLKGKQLMAILVPKKQ